MIFIFIAGVPLTEIRDPPAVELNGEAKDLRVSSHYPGIYCCNQIL